MYRISFDKKDANQVAVARILFERLVLEGHEAHKTNSKGEPQKSVVKTFDPDATDIIFQPTVRSVVNAFIRSGRA